MRSRARQAFNRLFDIGETETAFGRALLRERYGALQRQIPLLYTLALVNFLGLLYATGGASFTWLHPSNLLVLLVVVRLGYWIRTRGQNLPPERIVKELRRTLVIAGVLSIGFACSAVMIFLQATGLEKNLVILFAGLAAVGCAYGLTSFPAAARLPLLLFALPFAGFLCSSPVPVHVACGVSLALIALLTMRLVNLTNETFVALVRSRSTVETERERAQRAEQVALKEKARVRQVADTDPLTGLANRRAFLAGLEARLGRTRARPFGLALLDLDDFKPINDTFGHAAGDSVLVEVATRLRIEAGQGAMAARIGGDEFALILPCGEEDEIVQLGERICAALAKPYQIEGREFRISACAGLLQLAPGAKGVTFALSQADAALYDAKQRGRGAVALFTAAIDEANRRRVAIERALTSAAVPDAMELRYQPVYDLSSGALRAFEALARWTDPELGVIAPSEFVPIAEQINLIERISDGLLARAAAEAGRWPDTVRLSFNLSAIQLCSSGSAARVLDIVQRERLDPRRLQVEVTETALLGDLETARGNLDALRAAGARILLDDFGSGFASIAYLREMIFDEIKIDGSLVERVPESTGALRLLKGVIDLCDSLRVDCVAEHIERADQLDVLRRFGCREGQGFFLSPPLDGEAAASLAASRIVPFPHSAEAAKVRAA